MKKPFPAINTSVKNQSHGIKKQKIKKNKFFFSSISMYNKKIQKHCVHVWFTSCVQTN